MTSSRALRIVGTLVALATLLAARSLSLRSSPSSPRAAGNVAATESLTSPPTPAIHTCHVPTTRYGIAPPESGTKDWNGEPTVVPLGRRSGSTR